MRSACCYASAVMVSGKRNEATREQIEVPLLAASDHDRVQLEALVVGSIYVAGRDGHCVSSHSGDTGTGRPMARWALSVMGSASVDRSAFSGTGAPGHTQSTELDSVFDAVQRWVYSNTGAALVLGFDSVSRCAFLLLALPRSPAIAARFHPRRLRIWVGRLCGDNRVAPTHAERGAIAADSNVPVTGVA